MYYAQKALEGLIKPALASLLTESVMDYCQDLYYFGPFVFLLLLQKLTRRINYNTIKIYKLHFISKTNVYTV